MMPAKNIAAMEAETNIPEPKSIIPLMPTMKWHKVQAFATLFPEPQGISPAAWTDKAGMTKRNKEKKIKKSSQSYVS